MSDITIAKAPPAKVILPFFVAGAIAFLLLAFLLMFSADAFGGHYFHPKLLALVHIAAIGWGIMIAMGTSYQLLPVILEKDIFSPKLSVLSFVLLTPGVILLAWSFWNFDTGSAMKTGALLITSSICIHSVNIIETARGTGKYTIQKFFILSSVIWLVLTAVIGSLLAFNFTAPLFSNHLGILRVHAHVGLVGWFLGLIIGTGSKLIPMFLLGKSEKNYLLHISWYCINAGLLFFIAIGFMNENDRFIPYIYSLVSVGILFFLLYIADVFRNRAGKKLDHQLRQTFFSVVLLPLIILLLPFLVTQQAFHTLTLLYGFTIFMGWISSIIMGMTFKTLPFIVWNERYKQLSGKVKVPLPKQLYSEPLLAIQFIAYLSGFIAFSIGIAAGSILVMQIASAFLLVAAISFAYNVFRILLHMKKYEPVA